MVERVVKSITQFLKSEFKNVDVNSTDIDAGYTLPCFFIEINSIKTEKFNNKVDTLYINIDILYACENEKNNQKECFKIAEKLRNLLLEKTIKLDDNISFQIYEDSIDIEDDYVSISFDIEMNLIKDIDKGLEDMKEIFIK